MAISMKSLGIDQLPFEERLSLAEELWDSIASDPAAFPLTDAQRSALTAWIEAGGVALRFAGPLFAYALDRNLLPSKPQVQAWIENSLGLLT